MPPLIPYSPQRECCKPGLIRACGCSPHSAFCCLTVISGVVKRCVKELWIRGLLQWCSPVCFILLFLFIFPSWQTFIKFDKQRRAIFDETNVPLILLDFIVLRSLVDKVGNSDWSRILFCFVCVHMCLLFVCCCNFFNLRFFFFFFHQLFVSKLTDLSTANCKVSLKNWNILLFSLLIFVLNF